MTVCQLSELLRRAAPKKCLLRGGFAIGCVFAALIGGVQSAEPPAISVGSRRELFVDRALIDQLAGGATLRLHTPTPREQVLTFDQPWEGVYSGYITVFEDEGRLRLYYRGLPVARHSLDTEVTCYAESEDGVHWIKPNLGLYEVQGTRENNVVLAHHRGCHNFAPFKDTNPATPPDARYKALGGTGAPGLIAFVSADGLNWRELQPEPVITEGAFDSQNVAFWSETEQQYVCYFRVFREGVRWIARTTSADFTHWTKPVDMSFGERVPQHLYTNQTVPYFRAPHLYLGMPTRFFPGRRALTDEQLALLQTPAEWNYGNDCADIVLTSTRGGNQLDRTFMEAFVRPGLEPRNWTSRANYAARGIVPAGPGELAFYVSHNLGYPTAHLRRYTLRLDGFASINAPFDGGELITRPMVFAGERLAINAATSAAGSVRIEIQDWQGRPIAGFAAEDCDEMIGDQIERVVRWRGSDNLAAFAGRPIRLRVRLEDADLYSFRFE